MKLSEYFDNTLGRGVLATADSAGIVDAAVYSRPHFIDEETAVWIMTDRLTHANLQSNPHAAYIFAEAAENAFVGKRLYLTKIREESDPVKIEQMRWRKTYKIPDEQKNEKRFLVYFHVDKVLPLVGTK
ncbi:MAG: pyridoxamine 5-phosphate oxidase-related [Deltaproteobacteria bacterium]|nr:pyridoxamine 5-phosphate oxidase-related [Deltaproteobacteria bacterium]